VAITGCHDIEEMSQIGIINVSRDRLVILRRASLRGEASCDKMTSAGKS